MLKTSHRPDGKNADVLALTLACTSANASVNYSMYVPQRHGISHRPNGKIADVLALTHACTTANASVNYRMYVRQRPEKFLSPRWDFHMFCALSLQGGGLLISSGTVSFSSCTITGNTAYYVRAHAQKFPSPPMGDSCFARFYRAAVSMSIPAPSQ